MSGPGNGSPSCYPSIRKLHVLKGTNMAGGGGAPSNWKTIHWDMMQSSVLHYGLSGGFIPWPPHSEYLTPVRFYKTVFTMKKCKI